MKPFLITVAIFIVLYGPIALLLWRQARRARWHNKVEDSLPLAHTVWDDRTYGTVVRPSRGLALVEEDRTADDLMDVADAVAESDVCRRRWDVDPDIDGPEHTVPHVCVVGDRAGCGPHSYHECVCGAWRLDVEPKPSLREESIRCWAKYHYGLDGHYLCDLDLGHALPHADSRGQARVRWYGIGGDEQVASW